jgi:2'-5' RNA ligase
MSTVGYPGGNPEGIVSSNADQPMVERLFVALPLPESLRESLAQVQEELRAVVPSRSCAWVKPEAMHLTLRFLGNVDSNQREALIRELGASLSGQRQLRLQAERLGCFPNLRHPRVLWAWVHDQGEPEAHSAGSGQAKGLKCLQRAVSMASAAFTQQAEEPALRLSNGPRFHGHITLARVKQSTRRDVAALAQYVDQASRRQFGEWLAGRVELLRSEPTSTGSRYTHVANWDLQAGA